jgi:type VI secretion system protein VasJ
MLGLGKRQKTVTNWQWDVVGKHPAARDFFALGPKSLMAEAFSEWIRRGAENLVSAGKELLVQSCSWRFWARTPQAGMLACGVIRNSCDAVGRPFPLLVMGTGKLDNWEAHWELLPFACEGLWRQMEQLGSRKYAGLEVFQEDVHMLRPPLGRWKEMELEKIAHAERDGFCSYGNFRLDFFDREGALFLPFQDTGQYDFFIMIDNVHSLLKMQIKTAPNSFFMGGLTEQPGLALFQRPLSGQDFQRMWMPAIM